MATWNADPARDQPGNKIEGGEGVRGEGKRSKGRSRRARARRQARRCLDTPNSIPIHNQSNMGRSSQPPQRRQVWTARVTQNINPLSTPTGSFDAPYPPDDVQGEGGNMNVDHEMVESGEPQAGPLSALADPFYPNHLAGKRPTGILQTPSWPLVKADSGHHLPAMHDHLPVISTGPLNVNPYHPPGYVQYPHGYVQCPPGYGQYPVGIVQYPYGNFHYSAWNVQNSIPSIFHPNGNYIPPGWEIYPPNVHY